MIGKWVIVDDGDSYQVGVVTALIEVFVLVHIRPVQGPVHYQLFCMCDLTSDTMSAFFDTEAELDSYIAWIERNSTSKPKVVNLVKPTEKP